MPKARHQGGGASPVGCADTKLAQKDRDARWTVKWSKAKPANDGSPRIDLAMPACAYKNHVGIDRCHGLILDVTYAARHHGFQLPTLISKARELLAENGRRSQIGCKKPPRKPHMGPGERLAVNYLAQCLLVVVWNLSGSKRPHFV